MSLFHRKPDRTSSTTPGPNSRPNPNASPSPTQPNRTPQSRQAEHASEMPRAVDSNFCWSEDQDA